MTTGKPEKLSAIPTNIISGFLGVGKTSAILSLLEAKPENERWAVLVNEFGEIGIDGGFFEGVHTEQSGVFVREVPGGCMCCASGLSMQIALNQLLARSRPHRLLIEPTGLGHPREVLEVLSAEHYQEVLNIQKNITLVDARKLTDIRYTLHETFNQQIDVADIVVGNKEDLYQEESKQLLIDYVANRRNPMPDIVFAQHGKLAPSLLDGASDVVKAMKQPIPLMMTNIILMKTLIALITIITTSTIKRAILTICPYHKAALLKLKIAEKAFKVWGGVFRLTLYLTEARCMTG